MKCSLRYPSTVLFYCFCNVLMNILAHGSYTNTLLPRWNSRIFFSNFRLPTANSSSPENETTIRSQPWPASRGSTLLRASTSSPLRIPAQSRPSLPSFSRSSRATCRSISNKPISPSKSHIKCLACLQISFVPVVFYHD